MILAIRNMIYLSTGALVFIGFGIASILTDPNKDGIDGIPDIPVKDFIGYIKRMINPFRDMTTVRGSSTITSH